MLHTVCFLVAYWQLAGAPLPSVLVPADGLKDASFTALLRPLLRLQEHVLDALEGTLDVDVSNVSVSCRNATAALLLMARGGASAAVRMIDSVGKPSSGLMEGVQAFPGMYSECIGATVVPPANLSSQTFGGKYCLADIDVGGAGPSEHQVVPEEWALLHNSKIGLCVPSLCSQNDIQVAVQAAVSSLIPGSAMELEECSYDQQRYSADAGAIAVTATILVFVFLALVGTLYDVVDTVLKRYGKFSLWAKKPISTTSVATTNASSEILCEPNNNTLTTGSVFGRVLKSFSLRTNSIQLLKTSKSEDCVDVVHGIRFLTMTWIIIGHTFSYGFLWLFFRGLVKKDEAISNFINQWLVNGTFSVDTFLFLSGFLVTYVTMKKMKQKSGKLNILAFYIHRYIRMTPLMMAVIAISATLLQYVARGPRWRHTIVMYDLWCRENWWLNALYVHNFADSNHICLSHSWYSAVDMQLYLLSPLVILPLFRSFYWGVAVWFCCLFGSTITTATLTVVRHLPAVPYFNNKVPLEVINDYYKSVYIKPYCRIGPYLVGMALGYFIFVRQGSIVLKKKYVALGWFLAAVSNLGVLYAMWPANMGHIPNEAQAAMYSSLARTIWAAGLAWIVFACFSGYGGFVNSWLSWRPIVPLSRLTYSAYLIHPIVVAIFYGSREQVFDFSIYLMIYIMFGNFFVTYLMSFVLSLLFESPFIALEKLVLGHG